MYSQRIIDKTLDDFAAREGWRPFAHTVAEVEEFHELTESLMDFDSNSVSRSYYMRSGIRMTQNKRDYIRRFIQNEQFMCFADAMYFMTRYAYFCTVADEVFRYEPRDSQKILHTILGEHDDLQVAIELFILKARQLGFSTAIALYFLHRILFRPNTRAVMASVQQKQSDLIGRIQETCWKKLPFWLPPAKTKLKTTTPEWANNSVLSIQSGSQAFGIAQGWTPSCFVPNSRIRTSNGFTLNICALAEGDEVITHSGKLAQVKSVIKTRPEGDATKIVKLWGNYDPLECTVDHLLLTPGGWEEAGELCPGDYVCHPVRPIEALRDSITVDHLRNGRGTPEQVTVPLDFDLGYVAGLYLAEGCIHNAKNISETVFTVHTRELEDRTERVKRILGDRWKASTHHRKGTRAAQIKVYCSWLARWLAENFGRTTEKCVPDWAFESGQEFCLGLLRGFFDGDGHIEKAPGNLVKLPTVCYQLAYQMRDLIASVGFGWSSIYYRPAYEYRGMKKKAVWWVILSGLTGAAYRQFAGHPTRPNKTRPRHWSYSTNKRFIHVMVESVTDGWSECFWDIEVDCDDHSFTTTQCAAHNCIHISEVGDVPNPKKTLEEGLFRAAHSSKSLFFAIEGTGNRDSEWQYEKWAYYKANWGKGGRFRPFFVPPVCAKDLYPLPDWIRKNPIPANWRPLDETKRMQRKGELFIRSTDYLAKVMGPNFRMSEEYLWFWDCSYREAVASHTEKVFLSQMPCTDDEAFQSKSDKAFQDETIEVITNERQRVYMAYAITGKTILIGNGNQPYEPNPVDIDYGERRIPIRWDAPDGNHYDWELVPLKEFDDSDDLNCMNKLLVFRFPEEGLTYTAGVDNAQGLGGPNEDRSCISGDIVRGGKERDEQAFEFTSTSVNSPQMARIVACIAAWYGEKCKDPMGVKLAIEQIRKPGDECQHQLKLMGFYHHHRMVRYDSKGMPDPSAVSKEGWYTTSWSRSMMLNKFMDAINAGWYKPNSPILIRQIKELVRDEKHGESWIDHAPGKHDDNFFAGGMGYFTAHDMDNNALRQEQRYRSDAEKNAVVDMRWSSQEVTVD